MFSQDSLVSSVVGLVISQSSLVSSVVGLVISQVVWCQMWD